MSLRARGLLDKLTQDMLNSTQGSYLSKVVNEILCFYRKLQELFMFLCESVQTPRVGCAMFAAVSGN